MKELKIGCGKPTGTRVGEPEKNEMQGEETEDPAPKTETRNLRANGFSTDTGRVQSSDERKGSIS